MFFERIEDRKILHFYLLHSQNKTNLVPAFWGDINDISPFKNVYPTLILHGWQQPTNLSFTEKKGQFGAAVDVLCKSRFNVR